MPPDDLLICLISRKIQIFRILLDQNRSRRIAGRRSTTGENSINRTLALLPYHNGYDQTLMFSLSMFGIIL